MNFYGENNKNLYANGTPFENTEHLDIFLKEAITEVNGKKPVIITIGGPQSSAKTTLSIHLADRINLFTNKEILNLENTDNPQYSQGSKTFLRKLTEARNQGYKIIIWDETAADYRRKRSISNINKTLDEAMDMIRMFKMIVILVYHDFGEIPQELVKKKIITCLFQNQDRDVKKDYVISRTYNYGKMCLIKHNMKKSIIPEYAFKTVTPNFYIKFKDLSPERSTQLEKLSSNIKQKLFDKSDIALNQYLNQEDIADKLGMSKAWVRKKIKELNIQPERTLNKITYYQNNTLEKLRNKIKKKH